MEFFKRIGRKATAKQHINIYLIIEDNTKIFIKTNRREVNFYGQLWSRAECNKGHTLKVYGYKPDLTGHFVKYYTKVITP